MTASDISELRAAVEDFIKVSDNGHVPHIEEAYAEDFVCLRVPDDGEAVRLPRDTMLSLFASGRIPTVRTGATRIDHVEIVDGLGVVVVRREKDHGQGSETMFYCLLWRRTASGWRFVREYVHQRALPGSPTDS